MTTIVCSISTLDDLPTKDRSNLRIVLAALAKVKRFTVFEATADPKLASTLDRIGRRKLIRYTHKTGDFPWCKVRLTAEGRKLLEMDSSFRSFVEKAPLDDDQTFALIVRRCIDEVPLDLREFADGLRISRPTAERWKRGITSPHQGMRENVRRFLLRKIDNAPR